MQSDVHHVLPPSENAAWHYMGSTCANSPTVLSFLISVTFLSFSLLSPLCQGSAGSGWGGAALRWAHTRQAWHYLVNDRTETPMGPKGRERWGRADRTDEGWAHTEPGGRQRENVGSSQAGLVRWQVEIIQVEDPSESSWAQEHFGWLWMPQGRAGGRCWLGLAPILAPVQNLAMI